MGNQRESSSARSLERVHGVHIVPHSPFTVHQLPKDANTNLISCNTTGPPISNHRIMVERIWQMRPPCLRPVNCCVQGNRSIAETIANVLTSVPFIVLGVQAPSKNVTSAMYANSLIGVGVASSLYHSSRGKIRKYLRWADYTMIAAATIYLSRALRNENPRFLTAASAFCLPFQPLMVSAVHTGMIEVAFAKRASEKPELRTAHSLHTLASALGGALFIADDLLPETPYLHAAWHLAAAVGVGTCSKLLE